MVRMCSISLPVRSARKPPSATLRLPQRTTSFSGACPAPAAAAAAAPLALAPEALVPVMLVMLVVLVRMRMRMRGGSSNEPRDATSRSRRPSTPAQFPLQAKAACK